MTGRPRAAIQTGRWQVSSGIEAKKGQIGADLEGQGQIMTVPLPMLAISKLPSWACLALSSLLKSMLVKELAQIQRVLKGTR